jgi:hypothetical protein
MQECETKRVFNIRQAAVTVGVGLAQEAESPGNENPAVTSSLQPHLVILLASSLVVAVACALLVSMAPS